MEKQSRAWVHRGFEEFSKGRFDNGGDNLYVNANGVIESIHRLDVNNDGRVDFVFPNSHGYTERGPTWIYTQSDGPGDGWPRQELPNDSGWMSRVVDVDGDGYLDLIVVNGENGVTSELTSFIYWGGPDGLTGERQEFETAGAYDVAAVDLSGNGLQTIIFPSAWVDHHNAGKPRPIQVFEQVEPRRFVDATERHGLVGIAANSIACDDLNGDGRPELIVANYRKEFEYDTDSFLYWGVDGGFDASNPLRLPTHYAVQTVLGDLNGDGRKEIVFSGGEKIYIYWNRDGTFREKDVTVLDIVGNSTMFAQGAVRMEIADIDQDGQDELLVASLEGIEVRKQDDLERVHELIPLKYCVWVKAVDLDGDGKLDLIGSRYQDGRDYETESAIFWNGPDGFSEDRTTRLAASGAVGCTAGDLDGDGKPEIIFNSTMGGPSQFNPDLPVYVYLGSEANDYGPHRRLELPSGGGTNTYVLADLDLDGYADLAFVSPEGLRIFHGGPDGLMPDRYSILNDRGQPFHYVLVGDLNKNGWLDLIGVGYTYDAKPDTMASSTLVFWGSSEGFSDERSTVLPTFCGGNAQLSDVNQDGWLDVIYFDKRGYLAIYLGGPDGFSEDRMEKVFLTDSDIGNVCAINFADLNGNGWLDLILSVMGHYTRKESGFYILHGGPEGYSADRLTFHRTDASSILVSIADLNNDGYLDLLVPAYSTQFTRELPAHIFWGGPDGFDFENPLVIPCDSSCAFVAVDLTGNGYRDLLTICHRNDLGHQVDSLLFWNGPEGLTFDSVTRLPGLGPHLCSPRDFGNAFTREPLENYVSPPYELNEANPTKVGWQAETPPNTQVKLQLRWAETIEDLEKSPWLGPGGGGSFYETPGQTFGDVPRPAKWLQYKASLMSPNGCFSPKLKEVRIDFDGGG
jgi:hypothetical protein